ncbi:MAG: hypothetical protein ONB44_13765 [candidate division KSB1 bacterium]|nr:hypothetical protein [candidate division KSB1 bacterium]MDZ7303191.1 hypothetical protein [candidate division KSB1 bacterium]MDZ7312197.1 hypothetical protein [candidate division KSB1 bacterium]
MKQYSLIFVSALLVMILAGVVSAQEKEFKYMSPAEQKAFMEKWTRKVREGIERERRMLRKASGHPGHDTEKKVIISGNQITTVVYNYASISRPGISDVDLQWPKTPEKRLGYGYEFGPLVAAEVPDTSGRLIHIVDDGFILEADGDYAPGTTTIKWGWLPQLGFADPNSPQIATFTATDKDRDGKPDSWPEEWYSTALNRYVWPAFLGDDATTPDEEVYFRVDDFSNAEFGYYPFPDDSTLRGLGLEMDCRYFQFNNPLAEDIIFLVYTVTNVSPKDLDKVYFGMFGDPHVGGANDYADDYAGFISPFDQAFPFEARNMLYAYDRDQRGDGGKPTGYFGYKFLESPSISTDGKDNDGDQLIDETPFNDAGTFIMGPVGIYGPAKLHWSGDEDGDWSLEFDDVGIDGIAGTKDYGEADGKPSQLFFMDLNKNSRLDPGEPTSEIRQPGMRFAGGEPNFGFRDIAESDQLGLTSFNALYFGGNNRPKNDELMWEKMSGTLENPEIQQEQDNVFIYGCGPFRLASGESQRFSIALLMGDNLQDLVQNAGTAQQVFEADYRFAKPPFKPTLTVVPGDKKITLYWDTRAETSFDPFIARGTGKTDKGYDFEGYKIYRSEDYTFADTKIITDQNGLPFLSDPLRSARGVPAQFDLENEYSGFSSVEYKGRGVRYNLGDNTGLTHAYVDSNNIINGKRYFYAVVAYDHGDNDLQIPPTETQRTIDQDAITGQFTFDINTAMVIAGPPAAGYVAPRLSETEGNLATRVAGNATGTIEIQFIDPFRVRDGKEYEVQFTAGTKPTDPPVYSIVDLKPRTVTFTARDTVFTDLPVEHLVPGTVSIRDQAGNAVDPSRYEVNHVDGRIRGTAPGSLQNGATYTATFQFYPVYASTGLNREDFNPVFDGMKVFVQNDAVALDPARSGWKVKQTGTNFTYKVALSTIGRAKAFPVDVEIRFFKYDTTETGKLINPADTSFTGIVSNFKVYNTETGRELNWHVNETIPRLRNRQWNVEEKIHVFQPDNRNASETMYEVQFAVPEGQSAKYPGDGDVFLFFSRKPFEAGDKYRFKTVAAQFDNQAAKQELPNVYVVPNPYVAYGASEFASPRGDVRDERRLEFRNLPKKCTIRIYTITGELVDTIQKDDERDFAVWNVLTLESQATAYGIYIYHVDAPNVGTKIGRFAVIK